MPTLTKYLRWLLGAFFRFFSQAVIPKLLILVISPKKLLSFRMHSSSSNNFKMETP
jgi:hypothetical protein